MKNDAKLLLKYFEIMSQYLFDTKAVKWKKLLVFNALTENTASFAIS